jgi:hypothetical protein
MLHACLCQTIVGLVILNISKLTTHFSLIFRKTCLLWMLRASPHSCFSVYSQNCFPMYIIVYNSVYIGNDSGK